MRAPKERRPRLLVIIGALLFALALVMSAISSYRAWRSHGPFGSAAWRRCGPVPIDRCATTPGCKVYEQGGGRAPEGTPASPKLGYLLCAPIDYEGP